MKKIALGLSLAALIAGGTAYADHHGKRPNMDTDGDGVVTRSEAQAHSASMFARMDANNDGKLDSSDRDAKREQHRAGMFEALDSDKNGQISRSEFMAFDHEGMRGPGGKHHHMGKRGHRGQHMMAMADTNKDGAVTMAEFTAGSMQHFDRMDTNNDGKVSKEERDAARSEMRGKWRDKMRDRAAD